MSAPDTLFREIDTAIGNALRAIERGEIEQLDGLTDKVGALCEQVLALEKTEGAAFAPKLEVLRDKLDLFQKTMEEVRSDIAGEISATDQRIRASRAYRPVEEKK